MAGILYRLYLFFSAVTPAFIYSLVAALLVFLFSLRIQPDMSLNVTLFFAALSFSAGVRVLKDVWSLWPYAYHLQKFKVADDEIPVLEKRPLNPEMLNRPLQTVFFFAGLMALIAGLTSWAVADFALSGHHWVLWVLGSVLIPVLLALAVIVVADNFFRAYSKTQQAPRIIDAEDYLKMFYILPEVLTFLLLNVAIIWPLYRVETQPNDVAWVTLLVMSLISTAFLLANARVTPINAMSGALFSKIWSVTNIDTTEVDLSSPRQYQVWQFSFKKWYAIVVVSLMCLGTAFMASGLNHWFFPFLLSAECLWVTVYLYLRIKVLRSTLAKVSVFYRQHNGYYQAGQFSTERQLPAELAL